jgi:hypothetical protein
MRPERLNITQAASEATEFIKTGAGRFARRFHQAVSDHQNTLLNGALALGLMGGLVWSANAGRESTRRNVPIVSYSDSFSPEDRTGEEYVAGETVTDEDRMIFLDSLGQLINLDSQVLDFDVREVIKDENRFKIRKDLKETVYRVATPDLIDGQYDIFMHRRHYEPRGYAYTESVYLNTERVKNFNLSDKELNNLTEADLAAINPLLIYRPHSWLKQLSRPLYYDNVMDVYKDGQYDGGISQSIYPELNLLVIQRGRQR